MVERVKNALIKDRWNWVIAFLIGSVHLSLTFMHNTVYNIGTDVAGMKVKMEGQANSISSHVTSCETYANKNDKRFIEFNSKFLASQEKYADKTDKRLMSAENDIEILKLDVSEQTWHTNDILKKIEKINGVQ